MLWYIDLFFSQTISVRFPFFLELLYPYWTAFFGSPFGKRTIIWMITWGIQELFIRTIMLQLYFGYLTCQNVGSTKPCAEISWAIPLEIV